MGGETSADVIFFFTAETEELFGKGGEGEEMFGRGAGNGRCRARRYGIGTLITISLTIGMQSPEEYIGELKLQDPACWKRFFEETRRP